MNTPLEESGSVTWLLAKLAHVDELASERLWKLYFPRLVQLAENLLQKRFPTVVNGEDIASSVLETLFLGAASGRFDRLGNRDELWRLLVVVARHKVADRLRRELRAKRGAGRVLCEAESPVADLDTLVGREAEPVHIAELQETIVTLLDRLSESQRSVALCRLEGLTVAETAERLAMSQRSVERKLQLIRETWGRAIGDRFEDNSH